MSKILLRPMKIEDCEVASEIVAKNTLWQRYEYGASEAKQSFEMALYRENEALIVATTPNDKVLGFAWYQPTGGLGRAGYLRLIGIDPKYQCRGIGKKLLQEVERGCVGGMLMLLVSDFNERGQKFYKREGYTEVGTFEKFVHSEINEMLLWKKFEK